LEIGGEENSYTSSEKERKKERIGTPDGRVGKSKSKSKSKTERRMKVGI
jgi:hypothetical protein